MPWSFIPPQFSLPDCCHRRLGPIHPDPSPPMPVVPPCPRPHPHVFAHPCRRLAPHPHCPQIGLTATAPPIAALTLTSPSFLRSLPELVQIIDSRISSNRLVHWPNFTTTHLHIFLTEILIQFKYQSSFASMGVTAAIDIKNGSSFRKLELMWRWPHQPNYCMRWVQTNGKTTKCMKPICCCMHAHWDWVLVSCIPLYLCSPAPFHEEIILVKYNLLIML